MNRFLAWFLALAAWSQSTYLSPCDAASVGRATSFLQVSKSMSGDIESEIAKVLELQQTLSQQMQDSYRAPATAPAAPVMWTTDATSGSPQYTQPSGQTATSGHPQYTQPSLQSYASFPQIAFLPVDAGALSFGHRGAQGVSQLPAAPSQWSISQATMSAPPAAPQWYGQPVADHQAAAGPSFAALIAYQASVFFAYAKANISGPWLTSPVLYFACGAPFLLLSFILGFFVGKSRAVVIERTSDAAAQLVDDLQKRAASKPVHHASTKGKESIARNQPVQQWVDDEESDDGD